MGFLFIIIPVVFGALYIPLLTKWVKKSRRRALKAIELNNGLLLTVATIDLLVVFTTIGELFGINSDLSLVYDAIEIGRTKALLIVDICLTIMLGVFFLAALRVRNGLSDHRKFWVDKKIQNGVFLSLTLFVLAFITLAVDVVMYCI